MKLTNVFKKIVTEITTMELKDKYYPNVPNELYQKILRLDPTYKEQSNNIGKYTKWLLSKENLELFKSIKEEDYYKIREDLSKYNKLKTIKKISPEHSNIDKFDINSLASLMFEVYADAETKSQNEKASDAKKDAEKYEAGGFYIIVPKTEAASCYYGKGTRWCTTAKERNMFNDYNERGRLWILINKNNPKEKYQFHKEDRQYMNAADDGINLVEFFEENPKIYEFFKNVWDIDEDIDFDLESVFNDHFKADDDIKSNYAYYLSDRFDPYTDATSYLPSSLMEFGAYIDDAVFNDLKVKAIKMGYLSKNDSNDVENFEDLIKFIEDTKIQEKLENIFVDMVEMGEEKVSETLKYKTEDYIDYNKLLLTLYYNGIIDDTNLGYIDEYEPIYFYEYPKFGIDEYDSGDFTEAYFND